MGLYEIEFICGPNNDMILRRELLGHSVIEYYWILLGPVVEQTQT